MEINVMRNSHKPGHQNVVYVLVNMHLMYPAAVIIKLYYNLHVFATMYQPLIKCSRTRPQQVPVVALNMPCE